MIGKKRDNISPLTILSSIAKEVKELLPEVTKPQKAILLSIQESIKLLSRKLSSSSSTSYPSNDQSQLNLSTTPSPIDPSKENKSKLDEELTQLRQENVKLKSELSHLNHLLQDQSKLINRNDSTTNDLRYALQEEKANRNLLLLQVKTVEDNFKTLNKEYQELSERHEVVLKDMETLCQASSEMKAKSNGNRYKYDDLAQINTDLKKKLISYENTISIHYDELKGIMKKNNTQKIHIEELEKVNKALNAEVNYKEERIKALRLMNAKLEMNTKKLISKWGSLSKIEEKNNQISQEAIEAFDTLREMNEQLNIESTTNRNLQMQLQKSIENNQALQKEIKNLNDINVSIKEMNKELINKNKELEYKYQNEFNKKESNILSRTFKGNQFLSISSDNYNNNNMHSNTGIPLESLQPAKLELK